MRCLLIDDNPIDLMINEKVLSNCFNDLEVAKVLSGNEALSYLSDQKVFPEVILLDINMPEMNGFEFLEEYKRLFNHHPETKIYILSSSIDPTDISRASGNNDIIAFIKKPLSQEEVNLKLR
jgi:CheY-like chemotaxis protein